MTGRLRQPKPQTTEPFAKVPMWLLKAVSGEAVKVFAYYSGMDYDGDGRVYLTTEQTAQALGMCLRKLKKYRAELHRGGAISCKRGSPATFLYFTKEVQDRALQEVQDHAHRTDSTNRQVPSTESEEKKDIHPPSENEVLTDNRTSARSCTSPDAQNVSTGEEELDLEELMQRSEHWVAALSTGR
jgi:hypothetical protein